MSAPPVTFYLPPGEPLARLAALDPDRDWLALQRGERAWILQTYLRLRAAGHDVALGDRPRPGILVYHAHSWRRLERQLAAPGTDADASTLVAVRGDLLPAANADLEVVQDPATADHRRFFLPHWPQPGLLPRQPARGTAVRRAAFKGIRESLHHGLRDPAWAAGLAALGVEWEGDETAYAAGDAERARLRWPDYRQVDVVVALRPPSRGLHPGKPASKLVNAWLAGVPAVLGCERAYRAMRRSDLDYLEAATAADALAAVARLADSPQLYQAMVENGRQRGAELSPSALVERWCDLLFTVIPLLIDTSVARRRRLPRPLRLLLGRARRRLGRR